MTLALDELEDCASQDSLEKAMDRKELAVAFNGFLESLPETERLVFLSRYWYLDPIADIAEHFGFSVSKVTSMLRRTRGRPVQTGAGKGGIAVNANEILDMIGDAKGTYLWETQKYRDGTAGARSPCPGAGSGWWPP